MWTRSISQVNSLLLNNYLAVGHSETMAVNNLNVVTSVGFILWIFIVLGIGPA